MILRSTVPLSGVLSLLFHATLLIVLNLFLLGRQSPPILSPFESGLVSLDVRILPRKPTPFVIPPVVETPVTTIAPIPSTPVEAPAEPAKIEEIQQPAPPVPEEPPPLEQAIGVIQEKAYPKSTITVPYPVGSRRRGEEGLTRIHAVLSPQGHVLRAEVELSSGFPSLDRAALNAMRRALFHVPPGENTEQDVSLTFQFRLTD